MHPFLLKSTSTLMAFILAISASLCRCATAACDATPPPVPAQTDSATPPCHNGCSAAQPPSTNHESPATCTDCGKGVALTKPQIPTFQAAPQLHRFLTPAADVTVTPPGSSQSLHVRVEPPGARIDVLLRSCILLI